MDKETLNRLGVEPVKVSDSPEAYKVKLRDTAQTVAIIQQFIKEGSEDIELRKLVADIISPCKSKDFLCYLKRIVSYIRRNVKYVYDPPRLETVQSAKRTLILGMGDCDDHTVLAGTLLRIAGFPIKIVLGDINYDGKYEHVFIKAKMGNRWLVVDTTAKNPFKPKPYPTKEIDLFEEVKAMSELEKPQLEAQELGLSLKDIPLIGRFFKKREERKKAEVATKVFIPLLAILGAGYLLTKMK